MNPWSIILLLTRRSLILLGVIAALCIAAVGGLSMLADSLRSSASNLQANLQEQQATLQNRQDDLRNVREHIQAYETLRKQGLVGAGERALWVEKMQASYQALMLPGNVAVQLQAAKPLAALESAPDAPAPSGDALTPMAHDLQFELRNVHEGELLSLLADYRANVKGRFRVNSCELREPSETGMSAQCVLRFVTIPTAPVATTPAPGT